MYIQDEEVVLSIQFLIFKFRSYKPVPHSAF
uniref:Uncharacterized protein n=1 Tax=Anguilla anguilla TaxID=7936 RepID=A0A0E9TX51_ANGAN